MNLSSTQIMKHNIEINAPMSSSKSLHATFTNLVKKKSISVPRIVRE